MEVIPPIVSAPDVPQWMQRTKILMGEAKVQKLITSHVMVVGLGGVGGIAAEMIVRAGVGTMTIIDNDTVDPTNKNRQIPALSSTVGNHKVIVMEARLKDINPDLKLEIKGEFLGEGNTYPLVTAQKYDYVLDCIDTLTAKCWLIRACIENNIPVATSMGAGGKTDPTLVHISDISESKFCNFAASVRRRLGKWGIKSGIPVVYSTEEIEPTSFIRTPNQVKKTTMGTISYMPAIFGCMLASVVIRDLCAGSGTIVKEPAPMTRSMTKRLAHKKRMKERKAKEIVDNKRKDTTVDSAKDSKEYSKRDFAHDSKVPVGPSQLVIAIVFQRVVKPLWGNKKLVAVIAVLTLLAWAFLKKFKK